MAARNGAEKQSNRRARPGPPPPDPEGAARAAGLRYVSDDRPGIRRVRHGKGFRYVGPDGNPVRDAATLERIRGLAVPPAWAEVWVCPQANGHVQATGRDRRGRKQYRYHPDWRAIRDETKYHRMAAFARALPGLRRRVEEDLTLPGLPRQKVLAAVVRLLETTGVRVGNEEYAKANGSFGLTTLRSRHVRIAGPAVRFTFRGKSGVRHCIDVRDRRLARIIRNCNDLPGQELFQYVDEQGETRSLDSADVNAYLREIAGEEFTAKDFRTWAGTLLAARELRRCPACESLTQARRVVAEAMRVVARDLGNTPAVCRRCYVHPAVIGAYLDGSLHGSLGQGAKEAVGLAADEALLLAFLEGARALASQTFGG